MRKFLVIAAALVAAGAGITATTRQLGPPQGDQRAEMVPGDVEDWAGDAFDLADDQAAGTRQLAIMPGRGVELGITIRDLEGDQLKTGSGASVESVREGSAAEKAGIKKGDVIVEFDGEHVRGQRHLQRLVSETPEGRTVKAAVMRDGKRVDLSVTPATSERAARDTFEFFVPGPDRVPMPGMPGERFNYFSDMPRVQPFRRGEGFFTAGRGRLGIATQSLTPQLSEYFGTKGGVLVTSVQPDSPAAKAGLKAGDVITTIEGRKVENFSDLIDVVQRADDGASLKLGYVRDKKAGEATATLEKPDKPVMRPSERPI